MQLLNDQTLQSPPRRGRPTTQPPNDPTTQRPNLSGILVVDKPTGITSAAVVRQVKRVVQVKIGHLGTLDPFASGVLPLCLGEGTKIAQFLTSADKEYEGVIRLGIQTDTGDLTGAEIRRAPVPPLSAGQCQEVAARLTGECVQTPPMYSAIKQDGVPLYKLARRGMEVERTPRVIRVSRLELTPDDDERLAFRVACSKGTYVRVLAEDIGAALGTVAHLERLRRTRFGNFTIDQALALPITREQAEAALISPRQSLQGIDELVADPTVAARIRRGQVGALRLLERPRACPATAKVVAQDGSLLAIVVTGPMGNWQFARVLAQE